MKRRLRPGRPASRRQAREWLRRRAWQLASGELAEREQAKGSAAAGALAAHFPGGCAAGSRCRRGGSGAARSWRSRLRFGRLHRSRRGPPSERLRQRERPRTPFRNAGPSSAAGAGAALAGSAWPVPSRRGRGALKRCGGRWLGGRLRRRGSLRGRSRRGAGAEGAAWNPNGSSPAGGPEAGLRGHAGHGSPGHFPRRRRRRCGDFPSGGAAAGGLAVGFASARGAGTGGAGPRFRSTPTGSKQVRRRTDCRKRGRCRSCQERRSGIRRRRGHGGRSLGGGSGRGLRRRLGCGRWAAGDLAAAGLPGAALAGPAGLERGRGGGRCRRAKEVGNVRLGGLRCCDRSRGGWSGPSDSRTGLGPSPVNRSVKRPTSAGPSLPPLLPAVPPKKEGTSISAAEPFLPGFVPDAGFGNGVDEEWASWSGS